MKRLVTVLAVGFAVFMGEGAAYAAHPLITDDTGTQGKGKIQFEFIGEYGVDKEDGETTKSLAIPTVPFFSYGVNDAIDLVLGLPYQRIETDAAGTATTVRGIADASIELKWRFHEKDGLSFAVKPGASLPTGDEEKGLGNGKTSYSAYFITTREAESCAFHFNIGYVRNEYKLPADEAANRKDIWHVSLAAQVEAAKGLQVVTNIGAERSPDKASDDHPAFILGGLIYSVGESLDLDIGVKAGLNDVETDVTILAGITWRL